MWPLSKAFAKSGLALSSSIACWARERLREVMRIVSVCPTGEASKALTVDRPMPVLPPVMRMMLDMTMAGGGV